MKTFVAALISTCCIAGSAFAASYPVSGKWGQDPSRDKGAIDCNGKRTINFVGERRFDSGGGVPDYRAIRIEGRGSNNYQITEEFRTGQINGRNSVDLHQIDADHIELNMRGGSLKLRPCK
ncbi:MAG TPA: hypothetical protein VFB45_14195 [Pseudolabrys sp.]|nr:hypothetical protein [Pseudolabrys sp.]